MKTNAAWLIALALAAGCGNNGTSATPPTPAPPGAKSADTGPLHHDLTVQLEPATHAIRVEDRITGFATTEPVRMRIHGALAVESADPGIVIERAGEVKEDTPVPVVEYVARPATGQWPDRPVIHLRLRGAIHHPLESEAENYARSFSRTPGTISERGVMLNAASHWFPRLGDELLTFRMTTDVPGDWDVVSQGKRDARTEADGKRRVTWVSAEPMDEIYLIAAPFTVYESDAAAPVTTYAYLREADEALAQRYFGVTAMYVKMYSELLGPYPYDKFALVENFWETGYGMPSFTLLGPRIIRFPFILHSSYPHEILHNWWGNSVYVDASTGNWCEGLTAYLADHLIKEQGGGGVAYRRDTLKKYTSFVRQDTELSLASFQARHSSASEAIGYGKSLMLYHMVRQQIGDEAFVAGLRRFYDKNRFRRASYADLQAAFSAAASRDLADIFAQWVTRTGAPTLSVQAQPMATDGVIIELEQATDGPPYRLAVPVAVTLADKAEAHVVTLDLDSAKKRFEVALPGKPLRVDVDPYFDVFRRLHLAETPPVLGEIFGADRVLIILPDSDPLKDAWQQLAKAWTGNEGEVSIAKESEVSALPPDRAVWVLGAKNRWNRALPADLDQTVLGEPSAYKAGRSTALVARHPAAPTLAIGWLTSDTAAAIPGLARKLPHYGKYSYLGFTGDSPDNVAKGQWPVDDSPLAAVFVKGTRRAELPARPALITGAH